ncbi:hypothetical protein HW260_05995 [Helicobacter cinaedi]|uniref:Uncharacterized protein n=1 Tax=Helicobacter cinaedi CCUG 18818 = ATCC BAA-847 TaxID=537971 RepID=A0AAI8MLZ2_9HELI|nr:hypothetical protein [Helicobacter cinaedi]EFR46606.1 hypothetical protein HCCG_01153 [Helicobacter cinaedi CCUG 18818 = ATCC BAA-847]QOQ89846.1 hypothetical protein HW260_05995 [Helicobacter cinaedi]BAM32064.1 hypothetical protein HCBAA847_0826 [Helicobacter cinaedi CCUG 18818 = ATCC BAA-847]
MVSIPQTSPFVAIQNTKAYPNTQAVLEKLKTSTKEIYIFGGIQGGISLGSMVRAHIFVFANSMQRHNKTLSKKCCALSGAL